MTGNDKDQLKALARVRGSLNAMFLSDLVTADGKYLEQFAIDREVSWIGRSNYDFPIEQPSDKDWETWVSYLESMTVENFELSTPLGRWENPTHRLWGWLVDHEENICTKEGMTVGRFMPNKVLNGRVKD